MEKTSESLLARVKDLRDTESWRRFAEIYEPLLYRYARLRGLSREDASEVRQECMTRLVEVMPHFEYVRERGKFKTWLYRLASNKIRDLFKRRRPKNLDAEKLNVQQARQEPSNLWDEQWELKHLRYCLKQVLDEASPTTRQAFELYVISEWHVDRVAETLQISEAQVYAAKSRIKHRLRQRFDELMGSSAAKPRLKAQNHAPRTKKR